MNFDFLDFKYFMSIRLVYFGFTYFAYWFSDRVKLMVNWVPGPLFNSSLPSS